MSDRIGLFVAMLLLGLCCAGAAGAQCLLANPSFEMSGTGGATFAGWSQFGPTGSSPEASHGGRSARVTGPNSGSWGLSGYWQGLDAATGQTWVASVRAWNTSTRPLTGGSRAVLNIEWRNGVGGLIGYESHTVATASTPTERWSDISVTSQPAPVGAVQARLVVGVLQGPTDPVPDVLFDEATFRHTGPPTFDELQWLDFPGGRTLDFSGRSWRVKGPGYYGPGPNLFCNTPDCVWVDAGGRLHLTVKNVGGQWHSTEATLEQPLGYGDYVFTTVGRLDQLDPRIVFGLFLWQYDRCYEADRLWWNPFDEIDVEFSRWGNPANAIAQFVAQPYDHPGNLERFDASFANGELTSHAFRWLPDRVEFRSWRGGPLDEAQGSPIHAWTYTGPHIPRPEQPRVHLNLWQFEGPPGSAQEVVLDAFTFVPGDTTLVGVPSSATGTGQRVLLGAARPNPFALSTRIEYALPREGRAELAVYDLTGRRVRVLANGVQPAGASEVGWDGRDDSGRRSKPGVYLYRLSTGGISETGRMVLLR